MREFSAAEDEESFHVFYPGEDEPVIVAKYRLDPDVAAQIRSRVVPKDAPGHNEGDLIDDVPNRGRAARDAAVNAERARLDAQQAAIDDQRAGLDAMATDEAYADVPTERESEAMAGADQERALAEASTARERASAAARAEGSADAGAAWADRDRARAERAARANALANELQVSGDALDNVSLADSLASADPSPIGIESPAAQQVGPTEDEMFAQFESQGSQFGREGPYESADKKISQRWPAKQTIGRFDPAQKYPTDWSGMPDQIPGVGPRAAAARVEFDPMKRTGDGSVMLTPEQALAAAGEGPPPMDVPPPAPGYRAPGVAPAGSAGAGAGGRKGMGVKQSSERGGAWRESDGIGTMPVDQAQLDRDARAAVLANLAGEADKAAKDRDIAVQEQFLKDKAMLEQQNAADIARRDIEAKEMKRQIMEGKIDPTRLFSSMDGGRQAVTLISMVLGGLANGASGFRTGNVAVDMFDRMIDRDIAAQKDGLDRKQSMYRDFIQEGRDAQQAFLLTKAAMQEGLAAQLRLNASKLGSETAMMNAEQRAIAIESAAKANRDKAANDWTKTELDKRMTAAQIAKMRSDAQRQKEMTAIDYMNAQTAATKAGQGTPIDREYTIPVAPFAVQGKQGVRFTGFDKVQSGKIRDAGSNAESLLAMLEDAKEFRRDKWSAWIPSWAGGSDAKLAEMFKAQIMGAINSQRNYGALDIGSQQVLGFEAINPGDILTSDATTYAILDGVADATKRGYANILRSQTEEGPSAIPSSLSAPGGRKAGQ